MRFVSTVAMALAFLWGCAKSSARWESQEAAANTLVTAAANNDWARVRGLTRGDNAESGFEALARNEPSLLREASGHLKIIDGHALGVDSCYVSLRFPYRDSTEVFDMGMARDHGRWLVYYVTLPKRI